MPQELKAERRAADAARPVPLDGGADASAGPPFGAVRVQSRMLTGLFTLAVFYTMYFAGSLLIPIVLAVLLNLLLAPMVRVLRSYLRLPEWLGAALLLLSLGAGVIAAFYGLSTPATRWVDQLPLAVREIEDKLRTLQEPVEDVRQAARQVERVAEGATVTPAQASDQPQPVRVVVQSPSFTETVLSGTAAVTAGLVVAVVLLYFLLASGDTLLRQAVTIAPRLRDKKRVVQIVHDMEEDVSYYLLTISLINAGLGVAVGLVMFLLGMPNAILWGVMAALLNFNPISRSPGRHRHRWSGRPAHLRSPARHPAAAVELFCSDHVRGLLRDPQPFGPAPDAQPGGGVPRPDPVHLDVGRRGRPARGADARHLQDLL
jgi:predicted PurR-regulated permease PerM